MTGAAVYLDHLGGREVALRMVDGQPDDLLIDGQGMRPGTICRAIADRPMKGQGGMFLRGPRGSLFLRQVRGLAPGQTLAVQVTGCPEPGKAVPVTAKPLFKGRYAIVTPGAPGLNVSRAIRDAALREALLDLATDAMGAGDGGAAEVGLILRSACAGADPQAVTDDIRAMRDLAGKVMAAAADGPAATLVAGAGPHALARRDWPRPDTFDCRPGCLAAAGLLDVIDALRDPCVALSGGSGAGASMWVEATRALVAVDVNTGSDISPAAGLRANIAAARALPRQLRLRGLGGQIVVDFAPMPKKDRRGVEAALRVALRADPVETAAVGWTPLGHYELQRKRDRVPLSDLPV